MVAENRKSEMIGGDVIHFCTLTPKRLAWLIPGVALVGLLLLWQILPDCYPPGKKPFVTPTIGQTIMAVRTKQGRERLDAIEELGSRAKYNRKTSAAIPDIMKIVNDSHENDLVRCEGMMTLALIDTASVKPFIPYLIEIIKKNHHYKVIRYVPVPSDPNLSLPGRRISVFPSPPSLTRPPLVVGDGQVDITVMDPRALELRNTAITALGCMGPDAHAALPFLLELQAGEDAQIRAALQQFGVKNEPALEKLTLDVKSSDDSGYLDSCAFDAINSIDPIPQSVARRLIERIKSPIIWEKTKAIEQSADMGETARCVLPEVLKACADSDFAVRRCAMKRLLELKPDPPTVVPTLLRALKDSDTDVVISAVDNLGRLRVKKAWPTLLAIAYGQVKIDTDPQFRVRKDLLRSRAITAIIMIDPESAIPHVIKILDTMDRRSRSFDYVFCLKENRHVTKQALPLLIMAVQEGDYGERTTAAELLGTLGCDASDAVPALIKALSYPDTQTALSAGDALCEIHSSAEIALPAIFNYLKTPGCVFEHPSFVDKLFLFGNDPQAVAILKKMATDPNKRIQGFAEQANQKLSGEKGR